jgi:DUF4097 and DUF4098 domain-containing protein YvlB
MMSIPVLIGAVALLSFGQQTDTTFAVPAGARLDLRMLGGEVIVRTWDRPTMRVQADHSSRVRLVPRISGSVVTLETRSDRGIAGAVDFQITVPASMGVNVHTTFGDVTIEGVAGEVTAATMQGDVSVRGGSGRVVLQSVKGNVSLAGARGNVEAKAVSGRVRVTDVTGDVTAQSVSGSVVLERIDTRNLSASTVSGNVSFAGPIRDGGRYTLITHSGDILVAVPDAPNGTFTVATLGGSFRSAFPLPAQGDDRRRRRTFILGTGSATIEMESFSGNVTLERRPLQGAREE